MALSIPERIAQVAELICDDDSHGYSQPNRDGDGTVARARLGDGTSVVVHGGDYDCSEMVRVCVNCAISGGYDAPIPHMWTGNQDAVLKGVGFERVAYSPGAATRGAILWRQDHTAVALGRGMQAEAYTDERGGIVGPRAGDQTGLEVRRSMLSGDWERAYLWPEARGGEAMPGGPAETTREDEDMVCVYRPNDENYLVYYDGCEAHRLTHPDELTAIDMVYQATHGGASIPMFEFGHVGSPWAWRFHNAIGRGL